MTDPTKPMGPSPRNMPSDKPADNLRDARLARALQHMPDAHMQPSAQTRHAVLQEATRAVGVVAPQRRWWHALLGQPDQRVPWGAAVASLAIFGFITVMWYGQEVPDAAPDRSAVVAQKADAGAEVKAEATAKASDLKRAETAVSQATSNAAPNTTAHNAAVTSAVTPEHKLAKAASSADHQAAPPAATTAAGLAAPARAPATAPAAPSVAGAMADAAAPAAPVAAPAAVAAARAPATANAAMEADAPVAQARLERRSKAMQSEEATADRLQARESGALAARAGAAPPAVPAPAAIAAAPDKARFTAAGVWVLTLGDVKRSLRPEQAQKLVALLRGLSYAPVTVPSPRVYGPADAIRLDRAGIESWVITPGDVTQYLAGSGAAAGAAAGVAAPGGAVADARGAVAAQGSAPQRSAITPAQYEALRRLAMELGAEPSHPLAP